MKFKKALKQLGPGMQLGIQGTDWSWHYQWKYDSYYETMVLVDQEGKLRPVLWTDFENDDFILRKVPKKNDKNKKMVD